VIESIQDTGEVEEVVAVTTSLGSFVAGGFVVKNCDTPFTWDWDRYDPEVELKRVDSRDVVAEVEGMDVPLVVVTGGEPLLQQSHLVPLVEALKASNHRIEIETAGTIAPSPALTRHVDRFNVSPKLANSGNPLDRRYKPDVLRAFASTGRAVFKFVVCEAAELEEVQTIVDECHLAPSDVWVMPEGTDARTLLERQRALADAVTARGWHLTTRLHILLWGDERGR
jgi:organic radical activating enzyme